MAELKTKLNDASVEAFLNGLTNEQQRTDSYAIIKLMHKITGCEPKMWGSSIVGFDSYHYKYDSGHEGDMALVSFSPRKASISLYLAGGFYESADLMKKLGKYKTGKGCLYIKTLADVDEKVLKQVIALSIDVLKRRLPR